MAASVKPAAGKRQRRSPGDKEVKRRVAGDDSHYSFVLQRYDGVILPEVEIRFPSVTSVIKAVTAASGGGMAYWGYKLGLQAAHVEFFGEEPDEQSLERLYTAAKASPFAPNRQRDKAGDRGNAAHDVLEGLAKGKYLIGDETSEGRVLIEDGRVFLPDAYGQAVIDWWQRQGDLVPIEVESVLYSLRYRYCGSVDLIALRGGELWVLDLKTHKPATSDGPAYMADRVQVAAYAQAYEEMGGWDGRGIDRCGVLLACEDGTWVEDTTRVPFEAFLAIREAYYHLVEGGQG